MHAWMDLSYLAASCSWLDLLDQQALQHSSASVDAALRHQAQSAKSVCAIHHIFDHVDMVVALQHDMS